MGIFAAELWGPSSPFVKIRIQSRNNGNCNCSEKKLNWRRGVECFQITAPHSMLMAMTATTNGDDDYDDGDDGVDDGDSNHGGISKEEPTLEERGGRLPDNRTSLQPSRT